MKKNKTVYFSTGCEVLDMVVGGAADVYGFPSGKFINIVGDKSAGKTFLANEIIAAAYHRYGSKNFRWMYDDCESGYSFDTKSMYGVDIITKDSTRSETIEQAFCNISDFAESLTKGQFGVYVLDSLDGLSSIEAEKQATARIKAHKANKEYNEGSYNMGKPRYLSREFFPQLCSVIQDKNILVIIISQVRENIDMFSFEKYKRNGGKALDFYAHTVLWLATMKKIQKKGRSVGVVVKAKVTKSKTPRPFRECLFSLLFDYGLDNIGTCLDFLFDLRTDKGELTPASKAISWGAEGAGEKPNVAKVKKWISTKTVSVSKGNSKTKEINALEHFKNLYERVNLENMLDFIEKETELKKEYQKEFGAAGGGVFNRDNLIKFIEESPDNNEKMIEAARSKWEGIEADIRTSRKKRYGTQPKGGE